MQPIQQAVAAVTPLNSNYFVTPSGALTGTTLNSMLGATPLAAEAGERNLGATSNPFTTPATASTGILGAGSATLPRDRDTLSGGSTVNPFIGNLSVNTNANGNITGVTGGSAYVSPLPEPAEIRNPFWGEMGYSQNALGRITVTSGNPVNNTTQLGGGGANTGGGYTTGGGGGGGGERLPVVAPTVPARSAYNDLASSLIVNWRLGAG